MLRRVHSLRPTVVVLLLIGTILGPARLEASPTLQEADQAMAAGLHWLETNQHPSGSWGTTAPVRDTAVTAEALLRIQPSSPALKPALTWLLNQQAPNNDFRARVARTLALANLDSSFLVAGLLASQNPRAIYPTQPNYPEGGWGIAQGYGTDVLDTALVLDALEAARLAGGLAVSGKTVNAGATDLFQFELPEGTTLLRIHFSDLVGHIQVRVKVGSPPTLADPWYDLTFPTYLGGLALIPGTHYIRVDGVDPQSTYSLQVSYVAGGFDTNSLLTPIDYLGAAQREDGGWGLAVDSESSNLYLSARALLTLASYRPYYDLQAAVVAGTQWLAGQQNPDGGWGIDGSTLYESALALYALSASATTANDPGAALAYVLDHQLPDGSWNGQAYDTALAILALAAQVPAAVSDLAIARSGSAISLDWSAVGISLAGWPIAIDHSNIYRSPVPFSLPAQPGLPYATTAGSTFVDSGVVGSPTQVYFYAVGAEHASGNGSTLVQQVGLFEFDIVPGG